MSSVGEWWAQPFAAEGSSASEGIRRQLGRPELDPLAILVREAAQNSSDAAVEQTVNFRVSLFTLPPERVASWQRLIATDGRLPLAGRLSAVISAETCAVLVVSDRGTSGLGGPLRADTAPDETPDFVNFVRNVGEVRDTELGGGTYGFGKGIFYTLSAANTILVDTQCIYRGSYERRLIGAALGDSFEANGRRYTGRYWWGDTSDGIPDPLTGRAALEIAADLSLPGFAEGETGTDVAVLAPDLGLQSSRDEEDPRSLRAAGEYLASAVLWNLWPKMIDRGNGPAMTFDVVVEGEPISVPHPESVIELAAFASAFRKLDDPSSAEECTRVRAPRSVGWMAVSHHLSPPQGNPLVDIAKPFVGPAHHCVRMRQVELVVDYFAGPPLPDEALQYGAVFRASAESDQYFADAEPPTHDDWVVSQLRGTALGVVRGANKFISDRLGRELPSAAVPPEERENVPLGRSAARLASFLPGTEGTGAGPRVGGDGRSSGPRTKRPRITDGPKLVKVDDRVLISATVSFPASDVAQRVIGHAEVALEGGGRETDPPVGSAGPVVLGWASTTGGGWTEGPVITAGAGPETEWIVWVAPVHDASTRVSLSFEEV